MNSIIGNRFGKLIAVEDLGVFKKEGTKTRRHYIRCKCDCGNECIVDMSKLKTGHTTSCGCKNSERLKYLNMVDNPSKYYVRPVNEHWVDSNNIYHIKMSNTSNEMLCDADDANILLMYYWHENTHGYARTSYNYKHMFAHRVVMGLQEFNKNEEVDHINGDKLDNRRCNLRIVTSQQNKMNMGIRCDNTSGVKGVNWDTRANKWVAQIWYNNNKILIGVFNQLILALT